VTQDSLFDAPEPTGTQLDEIVIYCDGGSRGNPGPSAIGAVVLDPSTDPPRRLATVSERIGVTTNNVAEYRALIAGLEAAAPFRARVMRVRADSKLVVEQVKGTWKVKQPHLRPLLEEARKLLAGYSEIDLQHVPRAENTDADALVNAALDAPALPE
jgi:ribonuclease HI